MLWFAVAALAASSMPAKLVIIVYQQPPTIVPYPSVKRCERAKTALIRQTFNPKAGTSEKLPGGGIMVYGPQRVTAYCIPG